ncbi:hypothetical protein KKB44_00600 [Candidatus Micrarchaeota archaeon]|nr:hypothetical protein [Candidatus Micrarchaeota archaeon]
MHEVLHHIRKRKNYPHPEKWKNLIDRLIYVVAFFGILMTIPQLFNIWIDNNAAGVSAVSWAAYGITASFWLTYGIAHGEKPLIVINSVWVVLDILIVIGTLFYS